MLNGMEMSCGGAEEAAKFTKDHVAEIYADIQTASHPVLPSNATVEYMDEGAANVVYSLAVHNPHQEPETCKGVFSNSQTRRDGFSLWDGKLLRLRKKFPWIAPCAVTQANFLVYIYPLFDAKYLIEQHIVEVKPLGIIQKLNKDLRDRDMMVYMGSRWKPRLQRFQGSYLAEDDHGLIVEDMTPLHRDTELHEFKPKWLTQSRSAPEYSKRCRSCAKRARINASRIREGRSPLHRFCPLDLVSNDSTALYRAVKAILAINDPISPNSYRRLHHMSEWARLSPLLSRLASLQASLDPLGVFAADPTDPKFLVAMTLRDCSLYLQLPNDLSKPIIAKIGDLDLKLPEKAEYWKDVERPLLEEGWYMGLEREEDKQPLDCNLFPEHWTPRHLRATLQPKRWPDSAA